MNVKIDSNFVMATCAVLTLVGSVWAAVTLFVVNAIVARQNEALLRKIAEMCVMSMGAGITGQEIERNFKALYRKQEKTEEKLDELHTYAHDSIHEINGYLHPKILGSDSQD